MTPYPGRPAGRNLLRHLRTVAVLASAGMLIGIFLSAVPPNGIPLPFGAGHHQDRHAGTVTVRDGAGPVLP
ncbi:hypothetical protein [Streptomyces sp. NPDC048737]|uniref:hypothetical protein n=1 Tax=unclassified Streptomyces TaxID=2593676 RepID=UPI003446776F